MKKILRKVLRNLTLFEQREVEGGYKIVIFIRPFGIYIAIVLIIYYSLGG